MEEAELCALLIDDAPERPSNRLPSSDASWLAVRSLRLALSRDLAPQIVPNVSEVVRRTAHKAGHAYACAYLVPLASFGRCAGSATRARPRASA